MAENSANTVANKVRLAGEIRLARQKLKDPTLAELGLRRLRTLLPGVLPRAIVASTKSKWNSLLHPRGPDGRFIRVFGWVRWLDFESGRWFRGEVTHIDGNDGSVRVRRGSYRKSKWHTFSRTEAEKKLYSSPKSKAVLDLPSPKAVLDEGDDSKWVSVGPQAGSNPGGKYRLDDIRGIDLPNDPTEDGLEDWVNTNVDPLNKDEVPVAALMGTDVGYITYTDEHGDKRHISVKRADHEGNEGADRLDVAGKIAGLAEEMLEGPDYELRDYGEERRQRRRERRRMRMIRRAVMPGGRGPGGFGPGLGGLDLDDIFLLGDETGKELTQSQLPGTESNPVFHLNTGQSVDLGIGDSTSGSEGGKDEWSLELLNWLLAAEVDAGPVDEGDPNLYPDLDPDFAEIPRVIPALPETIEAGTEFYVKDLDGTGVGPDRVANELMANRLYELLGIPVPAVYQGESSGVLGSQIIPGELKDISAYLDDPEVLAKVHKGFVPDAWMANWDVVGLVHDNIVVDSDGIPWRIDAGGALAYRAQGAPKGSMFGPDVTEIDRMRGLDGPLPAGDVFRDISDTDLIEGARSVAGVDPQEIRDLGESVGVDPEIVDILISRRTAIIDRFLGGDDPYNVNFVDDEPGTESRVGVPGDRGVDADVDADAEGVRTDDERDTDGLEVEGVAKDSQDEVLAKLSDTAVHAREVTNAGDFDIAELGNKPKAELAPDEGAGILPDDLDIAEAGVGAETTELESELGAEVLAIRSTQAKSYDTLIKAWVDGETLDYEDARLSVVGTLPLDRSFPVSDEETLYGAILRGDKMAKESPGSSVLISLTGDKDSYGGSGDLLVIDRDGDEPMEWKVRSYLSGGEFLLENLTQADVNGEGSGIDFSKARVFTMRGDEDAELFQDVYSRSRKTLSAWITDNVGASPDSLLYNNVGVTSNFKDLMSDDVSALPVSLVRSDGSRTFGHIVANNPLGDTGFHLEVEGVLGEVHTWDGVPELNADYSGDGTFLIDPSSQGIVGGHTLNRTVGSLVDARADLLVMSDKEFVEDLLGDLPDPEVSGLSDADVPGTPELNVGSTSKSPVDTNLPHDWDFVKALADDDYYMASGTSFSDTESSKKTLDDTGIPGNVDPLIVLGGSEIETWNETLIDRWIMVDDPEGKRTYKVVGKPSKVTGHDKSDDGTQWLFVETVTGEFDVVQIDPTAKIYVMPPPRDGYNIPTPETKIIMGKNGDVRIGKHTVGEWWRRGKSSFGYMLYEDYTPHGKKTIGFGDKQGDIRKRIRGEVWFRSDNDNPIVAPPKSKGPGAKDLEGTIKAPPAPDTASDAELNRPSPGQVLDHDVYGEVTLMEYVSDDSRMAYVLKPEGLGEDESGTVFLVDIDTLESSGTYEQMALGYQVSYFTLEGETYRYQGKGYGSGSVDVDESYLLQIVTGPRAGRTVSISGETAKEAEWLPDGVFPTKPVTYEPSIWMGAVSTQEKRDLWVEQGGVLTADGEVPRPGLEVTMELSNAGAAEGTNAASAKGRIIEILPNGRALVFHTEGENAGVLNEVDVPALVVDRSAYGGIMGSEGIGNLSVVMPDDSLVNMHIEDGWSFYFNPDNRTIYYTKPDSESIMLLTPEGEMGVVLSPESFRRFGAAQKIGVISGSGKNSVTLDMNKDLPTPILKPTGRDGTVWNFVLGDWETFSEKPLGPSVMPEAGARREFVRTEDVEDVDVVNLPPITGSSVSEEAWDTDPMDAYRKSISEALEHVEANAQSVDLDKPTVFYVQLDGDKVEDFSVRVQPVLDKSTGERYLEFGYTMQEEVNDELWAGIVTTPGSGTKEYRLTPVLNGTGPKEGDYIDLGVSLKYPDELLTEEVMKRRAQGVYTPFTDSTKAKILSIDHSNSESGLHVELADGTTRELPPSAVAWETENMGGFNYSATLTYKWEMVGGADDDWARREVTPQAAQSGWKMLSEKLASFTGWGHDSKSGVVAISDGGVKELNGLDMFWDGNRKSESNGGLNRRSNGGVTVSRLLPDGTHIWMTLEDPSLDRRDHTSTHGRNVFIRVPQGGDGDAKRKSLGTALEAVGVSGRDQELPDEDDKANWMYNQIGSTFGEVGVNWMTEKAGGEVGYYGDKNPVDAFARQKKWDKESVEELLAGKPSEFVGRTVTLDDFHIVSRSDGRIVVEAKDRLAGELAERGKITFLRHTSSGYTTETDTEAKDLGLTIPELIARKVGKALGFDKLGKLSSSEERSQAGRWTHGQSSEADMANGVGNRTYYWTSTHRTLPDSSGGGSLYQIIISAKDFLKQMGSGKADADNWGFRSGMHGAEAVGPSWKPLVGYSENYSEITMKYGPTVEMISGVLVPEKHYEAILKAFDDAGQKRTLDGRLIRDILIPRGDSSGFVDVSDILDDREGKLPAAVVVGEEAAEEAAVVAL